MKILSIETSCDETAISLVEASGGLQSPVFNVLGNSLYSQIAIHKEYGGVYPMLAKREHAKNLTPILEKVLKESNMCKIYDISYISDLWKEIEEILKKEEGLYENFKKILGNISKPDIDVICVTNGPGLEPALWVGISFAVALGQLWGIPVVPVNHMEGHITSVLANKTEEFSISNLQFSNDIQFPALALLISGGHTELVGIEGWGKYKILGKTLDDAVGEAYDKTARMMGLPYPGGVEIAKLAKIAMDKNLPRTAKLPRPILHSHELNFSFSGLKTSVLYYLRDNFGFGGDSPRDLSEDDKADIAREIDDAVLEILTTKTEKALQENDVKTLIVAGGVIGNPRLREAFQSFESKYAGLTVKIPEKSLSTDNSIMIACAGYIKICINPDLLSYPQQIRANGNLALE